METTYSISKSILNRLALYGACLLGCLVIGVSLFSLLDSISVRSAPLFSKTYLLPGIALVLVVLCIPSLYLLARRNFDFFHPLVYPVWSYFFPAFVLGSFYFATGLHEPSFIGLIPDPAYYIPLSLFYVALGFATLSVGFSIPAAKTAGRSVARRLPLWDWDVEKMIIPFLLLLAIGRVFEIQAFAAGAVGYQLLESSTSLGFTYYYVSILGYMANFLLWLTVFKAAKWRARHYLLILFLLLLIPYSMMISGGKGELVRSLIAILFAYWSSGRKLRFRHGVAAFCLLLLAVVGGVTYGTAFRAMKGSEEKVSLKENYELWDRTMETVRSADPAETIGFAIENALRRFETITSVSVIVANYEQLAPLEGEYGLENNIWTYTWTAFIPRILWPAKPVISDARSLAALYFQVEDTSFAITPMGDLLRNFGPIGVCLGMVLLGFALRILYSALIEGQDPSAWRSATYYLLLTNISYESFYGTIFPGLVRVGLVALVGGLLVSATGTFRKMARNRFPSHG